MTPRPPVIAAWLVARTRSERYREEFLGDLEELFQRRALTHGRRSARLWFWRQSGLALLEAFGERRRPALSEAALRGRVEGRPRQPGGDSLMQTIGQDLRYAFRSIAAKPGFAATAIVMLALGIGANATIFSWVNSVLLNPMPGATRTSELVELAYIYKGDVLPSFSYPDYKDIAAASKQLSAITAFDDLAVGVVVDREAERAWAELVSANFFDVLGVPVILGRSFAVSDDAPASPAAVILSHAYWQRRFAGDPAVIGRALRINAQPFTIVGVAAEGFNGPLAGLAFDMWLPMGAQPAVMPGGSRLEVRGSRWALLMGRLAPGASLEQARAEFESTLEQLRHTWSSQNRYIDHHAGLFTLDQAPEGGTTVLRPVLLVLMAVAVIVLLITCANLAGLLLARATARQREIAIRLSMGAGRWRIVQQLLVEGMVLAALGSIAALAALRWTAGLLIGFAPPSELPIHLDVIIDGPVLWFTAAIAIGTVLLFALAPAVLSPPADLATTLRDSASAGRGFGRHRLRRGLVAAQVALSIALLVGAGLCIRSLNEASRMTPGFTADGVVVGWLDLFSAGYTAAEGRAHYARILERARTIPGVESATYMRRIPLGFMGGSFSDITVEGRAADATDPQGVGLNYVGPDYAATLRIPLLSGRDLSDDDVMDRPRVAVINETMARIFWKDREPIGGRFMFGGPRPDQEPQWITVVGVIERHQAADIDRAAARQRRHSDSAVLLVLRGPDGSRARRIRIGERRAAAGGPGDRRACAVLQREPV